MVKARYFMAFYRMGCGFLLLCNQFEQPFTWISIVGAIAFWSVAFHQSVSTFNLVSDIGEAGHEIPNNWADAVKLSKKLSQHSLTIA